VTSVHALDGASSGQVSILEIRNANVSVASQINSYWRSSSSAKCFKLQLFWKRPAVEPCYAWRWTVIDRSGDLFLAGASAARVLRDIWPQGLCSNCC